MAPRRAHGRLPCSGPHPLRGSRARLASFGVAALLGLVLLVCAAGLTGCGKRGGAGGTDRGPDLSTPEAVLLGVADALARGDLDALDARLTPDARAAVRRDLEAFRTALRDPAVGPRYVSRLPEPRGDAEVESDRKAILEGDAGGLLRLLMRASPRPPPDFPASPASSPVVPGAPSAGPSALPPQDPSATRLERDLPAGDGTRRRVVLVLDGTTWRVDRLQL